MGLLEEMNAHLGGGRTLYTAARGTEFRAQVVDGELHVTSSRQPNRVQRYRPDTVDAATAAIRSGAPPLSDQSAQVARSWVGAILDSMAGSPNPAKVRPTVTAPTAAPTGAKGTRRTPAGKAKGAGGSSKVTRKPPVTRPPKRQSAPSVADLAASIAQSLAELARSGAVQPHANGASAPAPAADTAALAALTGQVEQLTAQADALAAERDAFKAALAQAEQLGDRFRVDAARQTRRADDGAAQIADLQKKVKAWTAATRSIGVTAVAVFVVARTESSTVPDRVDELLVEAAKTWKSAPSGAVASCRSALELVIRTVAERVSPPQAVQFTKGFSGLADLVMGATTRPGGISTADVHLARSLYNRSSKANHGEAGWKATPAEALLMLTGVTAIAERAFPPSAS